MSVLLTILLTVVSGTYFIQLVWWILAMTLEHGNDFDTKKECVEGLYPFYPLVKTIIKNYRDMN